MVIYKLLSNIGGMAGSWLGASICSIIELIILIACTPFCFCLKGSQDRKGVNAGTKNIEDRDIKMNNRKGDMSYAYDNKLW